jgi:hypothetical protein
MDEYTEQLRRLQHARQHADLVIDTDVLTVPEVLSAVISYIEPGTERAIKK